MSITVEEVISTKTNHYVFGEWEEICEKYKKAAQMSCTVSLDEFPIDVIKKNKRMREFAVESVECIIINLTAVELMERDIVKNGDIKRAVEKAIFIYNEAWNTHHSYGIYEVCLHIGDLIDFIEEFIA